jgi:hypothetical protein
MLVAVMMFRMTRQQVDTRMTRQQVDTRYFGAGGRQCWPPPLSQVITAAAPVTSGDVVIRSAVQGGRLALHQYLEAKERCGGPRTDTTSRRGLGFLSDVEGAGEEEP